jgi:hypothetical protein
VFPSCLLFFGIGRGRAFGWLLAGLPQGGIVPGTATAAAASYLLASCIYCIIQACVPYVKAEDLG